MPLSDVSGEGTVVAEVLFPAAFDALFLAGCSPEFPQASSNVVIRKSTHNTANGCLTLFI
ncbi:hypothetical protein D3C81_2117380 [compost metagenome]